MASDIKPSSGELELASLEIGDYRIDHEHEALFRTLQQLIETPESGEGREDFFDKLSRIGCKLTGVVPKNRATG